MSIYKATLWTKPKDVINNAGSLQSRKCPDWFDRCWNNGRFILQRLLEAGYPVVVYDVSAEAIDLAKSWESEVVNSPGEVSNVCKFVLLCLQGNRPRTEARCPGSVIGDSIDPTSKLPGIPTIIETL
jgi:hypothetical protein